MRRISLLAGVLFLLMAPSAALAQSSTCQQYDAQTCSSLNSTVSTTPDSGDASPTSATTNTSGTLPFTGLDVVLLVAGGGALLSAGFVVRRVSRRLN
jgi:hypothetical protein